MSRIFQLSALLPLIACTCSHSQHVHTVHRCQGQSSYLQSGRAVSGDTQDALELSVHTSKQFGLIRQLALDVWSREDVLQVQPILLTLQPLFQRVTEQP